MINFEIRPTHESGQYYKTRNGEKIEVLKICKKGEFPVIGIFFNNGCVAYWTEKGQYFSYDQKSRYGIVSIWKDEPIVNWDAMPAWANWVAMDESGEWWWFRSKPERYCDCWISNATESNIPEKYNPKFTGSWKDSLVEKPK